MLKRLVATIVCLLMVIVFAPAVYAESSVWEVGSTELIDKDDRVDAQDYSASKALVISSYKKKGEIEQIVLTTLELGSGAVRTPAGWLYIFDADPAIAAGDTALVAAGVEHLTIITKVRINSTDWDSDGSGGTATVLTATPFHKLSNLYVSFRPDAGATSINDVAGDDEEMFINLWYRSE